MALELVGGAALGAAVRMLLKEVTDAKENTANFQQALTRLESTLRSVTPRVKEISRLNHKLKVPDEEMKELITILRNGQALVNKSSKISTINLVRKGQYSKELLELDYSLLRYFQTILPLDHSRDTKEILLMMRELHRGHFGAKDEEDSSKSKEDGTSQEPDEGESSKPKVVEYSGIQSCQDPEKKETVKLFQKMLLMMKELHTGLVGTKDEVSSKPKEDESSQEPNEGECGKPKVVEYSEIQSRQNPKKKETVILAKTKTKTLKLIIKIEDKLSKLDTWKFRLKGCTYIFDLEDTSYNNSDTRELYQDKRTNDVRNCGCKAKKHGYVMVSRIEKVKIGNSEFEQEMETSGKLGNHPNIVPPFGYCFYQSELFLFYDSFPEGGSLYTRLHEYMGMKIANCEYPVQRRTYHQISWESKLKISLGVARGISHLHSVKCVHGNLHSSNVLLNSDDGCISDYGLLKFSSAAKKSDVHSFGAILLEMVSETEPCLKTCDFFTAEMALDLWIPNVVCEQKRRDTTFIDKEERGMLKIALMCVEKDLDKRPEMDDVVKMIQKIQLSRKRIAYSTR